jgi:uncharacterized membrane-anchored protein
VRGAGLYRNGTRVASGHILHEPELERTLREQRGRVTEALEAFAENTMRYLREEGKLLAEGIEFPSLSTRFRDRHALVVARGPGYKRDLRIVKSYVRAFKPVLIAVDGGADALLEAGYQPDVIVGDPDGIPTDVLRSCAEVVVPAQLDGHAAGLERVQDLGVTAVTFPASGGPEDLALLLAEAHGASLVVTVGVRAGLREFLDRSRADENPSAFLTRLKLGDTLVAGSAVATLHRGRVSAGAALLLLLASAAAIAVTLAVSGAGNSYAADLAGAWHTMLAWGRELQP